MSTLKRMCLVLISVMCLLPIQCKHTTMLKYEKRFTKAFRTRINNLQFSSIRDCISDSSNGQNRKREIVIDKGTIKATFPSNRLIFTHNISNLPDGIVSEINHSLEPLPNYGIRDFLDDSTIIYTVEYELYYGGDRINTTKTIDCKYYWSNTLDKFISIPQDIN